MKREVQIILTADEGKCLTDGVEYLKQIRLPEGTDENIWNEITTEEALRRKEEEDNLM